MAKHLELANSILAILTIATIFLVFRANALKQGEYSFLELNLQWPKSYCNAPLANCEYVPSDFTIESLRPMYEPHDIVPPYNDTGCQSIVKPQDRLNNDTFKPVTYKEMITYWPSFHNNNGKHWQYNWDTYGKCYNTPRDPERYFGLGLFWARHLPIKHQLHIKGQIIPDNSTLYKLNTIEEFARKMKNEKSTIVEILEEYIGTRIRVTCNKDVDGKVQLLMIGICVSRVARLQDCVPRDASSQEVCDDATDQMVAFPA